MTSEMQSLNPSDRLWRQSFHNLQRWCNRLTKSLWQQREGLDLILPCWNVELNFSTELLKPAYNSAKEEGNRSIISKRKRIERTSHHKAPNYWRTLLHLNTVTLMTYRLLLNHNLSSCNRSPVSHKRFWCLLPLKSCQTVLWCDKVRLN